MKKKVLAALLVYAMTVSAAVTPVFADGGTTFAYGTTGYGVEMGDEGLNPHSNYSGWSALRYEIGRAHV